MGSGWNIDLPPAEFYKQGDEKMDGLVRAVCDAKVLAIDTETTGLVTWKDVPLFWSLSWGHRRICMESSTMLNFLSAFNDPNKGWIFANAKYDAHILANVGIGIKGRLIDTQVMHALLYEEQPHGLKDMVKTILKWGWNDFIDTFKPKKGENVGDVLLRVFANDPNRLIEYASNDAYGTYQLYEKLKTELENNKTYTLYPDHYSNLWDLFSKVEVPFTKVLWKCERNGIKIDQDYLRSKQGPVDIEIENIKREINNLAGAMINPNSPKQLQDYFFNKLGLQPTKYTKGGKSGVRSASVDVTFLEYYAPTVPMAKLMLRHRDLTKVKGTYIDGTFERLDPNGRLHTRFNQDVARTGRLSSSDPNLQNWPKPEGDEFKLRGAVVPEPGNTLIVADYEALEMRLLAAAAMEKDMIQIFLDGKDIHMGNAEMIFGIPYDDLKLAKKIDKEIKEEKRPITEYGTRLPGGFTVQECIEARGDIKAIGFGLNYGMKADKLSRSIKKTKQQAQQYIDQYMARYPAVSNFFKQAVQTARETGYSFTLLGRRRFLPEIQSINDMDRWQAERQACNTVIQGTAADVAKMAMINCDEANLEYQYGCRMLLQVHDELVFECPINMVGDLKNELLAMSEIKDWMEHPFPTTLEVPLSVSIGKGPSWLHAK